MKRSRDEEMKRWRDGEKKRRRDEEMERRREGEKKNSVSAFPSSSSSWDLFSFGHQDEERRIAASFCLIQTSFRLLGAG